MHEQSIIDCIRSQLDTSDCIVKPISLICSHQKLRIRLEKDIDAGLRQREIVERSIQRIPLYDLIDTFKINTADIQPEDVAKRIVEL